MKTLRTILTMSLAAIALSATALALPPGKGGFTSSALTKESDFESLKSGDKVALVCKVSDSITVIDIEDEKAAMELCKEGAMVHCPVCKKEYKVTRGNPAGKGAQNRSDVVIINDDGEPCMFYTRLG